MIIESEFTDIIHFWRQPEMWDQAKINPVSSLKYYDGHQYLGGNDINVHKLNISISKFFIYMKHNDPAGCLSYHLIDNTIRARGLFVHKQYRKQGVAESLLCHIIEDCKQTRPEPFIWALAGPNSMRVHFKCGFRQVTEQFLGPLPDGNVSMHNNCYMRLDL